MSNALFIIIILLGSVSSINHCSQASLTQFQNFVDQYHKHYSAAEYLRRYQIFESNLKEIHALNGLPGRTWTAGVNEYTDWTWEEFVKAKTGAIAPAPASDSADVAHDCNDHSSSGGSSCYPTPNNKVDDVVDLPSSVDWRDKGVLTPVKNQGVCGSCWTFVTTACLEAQYAMKTGNLLNFSEQNLLDCASVNSDHGCDGGWPFAAFQYVKYNGGIDTESDYAYVGFEGACQYSKEHRVAFSSKIYNITRGDENGITRAVANSGPVTVAIYANRNLRHFQEGGTCGGRRYSSHHGHLCARPTSSYCSYYVLWVVAVGYGTGEDGVDYFIMRNSWGTDWADGGYFKIVRGVNECGIALLATYATIFAA